MWLLGTFCDIVFNYMYTYWLFILLSKLIMFMYLMIINFIFIILNHSSSTLCPTRDLDRNLGL
jgi:hypothetical protein